MKKGLQSVVFSVLVGALLLCAGCGKSGDIYTAGVYTASAEGYSGSVTVAVEFDGSSINRRMEHACELLSAPDAQVKDIAGLVGYSNISHFSDAFRKKFGCTPSEYKRGLPF